MTIDSSFTAVTGTERGEVWRRFRRWEYLPLLVMVIVTLALHFSAIMVPADVVGDEYWYVEDARSIVSGEGDLRPEHPPLAKLGVIAGIRLFGDNPFGWRFFSILCGTAAIILFYFICRKLNMSRKGTALATFLFALDDMVFVQASLAMLDVYLLTFMLAGFLLYLRKSYFAAGIIIALSALCKLNGSLAIFAVFLHWLLFRRDKPKWMLFSLVSTGLYFLVFLIFFEYLISGQLMDPIQRTMTMLNITAANKFTIPPLATSSRPWAWLSPYSLIAYSVDLQYLSFISWTIQFMIIPSFVYLAYKTTRGNAAAAFGLVWFAVTYLTWIPMTLITNRVTYVFYFLTSTGAVCIGIALAISDIIDRLRARTARLGQATGGVKWGYFGIGFYLTLHLAIFLVFNPAFPLGIRQWLAQFFV